MNKKGFTLVELLAVIIILSLLAVITIPIINNTIEKNKKKAYKDTAIGVIRSVETYAANDEYKNMPYVFDVNDNNIKMATSLNESDVDYNGDLSSTGHVMINNNESTAIYIENSKYCAIKSYADKEVRVYDIGTTECSDFSADSSRWILDTADKTVERHESFEIPDPDVFDSEGEPIDVTWTVTNQTTGQAIGNDLTTVSGDYTNNLNDIIVVNYTGYDAGVSQNSNKQFIVRVIDTKKPTINSFTVTSTQANYNSNIVNIRYDAVDAGTSQQNLKIRLTVNGVASGWQNYGTYGSNTYTLGNSLDGTSYEFKLEVKDEANHVTETSKYYILYSECTNNITEILEQENKSNMACSSGILTINRTGTDNATGKTCDLSQVRTYALHEDLCYCNITATTEVINSYPDNLYNQVGTIKCVRLYYASGAAQTCHYSDCGYSESSNITSGIFHDGYTGMQSVLQGINNGDTVHSGDSCGVIRARVQYSSWSTEQYASMVRNPNSGGTGSCSGNNCNIQTSGNGLYIGNACYNISSDDRLCPYGYNADGTCYTGGTPPSDITVESGTTGMEEELH